MGKIFIARELKLLQEVTVVSMQDLIEEKADRLVYNAEKDVTARGGDASDILRKIPMLTVDLDGNVSLRGSHNVKVLINNKPSTIVATSVANALKQIPAHVIKSVEVITSPSARYDAEGVGGIINIITKKKLLEGATLTTDVGVGNRGGHIGLYGGYRRKKIGFNLGGYFRGNYNVHGYFENVQTVPSGETNATIVQSAETRNGGLFESYQLGWDYDIDSTSFLNGSVSYSVMNSTNSQLDMVTQIYLPGSSDPLTGRADIDATDLSGTVDASFAYTKVYKLSKELTIMGLYSRNNRINRFSSLTRPVNEKELNGLKNNNPNYNEESTIQIDFQSPLADNQLIEMGAKNIYRKVQSDYEYLSLEKGKYLPVPQASDALYYTQGVAAAYISHTLTTKTNSA
jgi:hypothetical protein